MGSKTVYNPPKIEKDDSFAKYLEYQKERETRLDERAQQEKADEAARETTRRKSGAKGLTDLYGRTKSQLESGLISFQGAQDKLQSYIDKYDLTAGFKPDDDTWYFPRVAGTFKERQGFHGCQMPEQLLGRIIRASSNAGDAVRMDMADQGMGLKWTRELTFLARLALPAGRRPGASAPCRKVPAAQTMSARLR